MTAPLWDCFLVSVTAAMASYFIWKEWEVLTYRRREDPDRRHWLILRAVYTSRVRQILDESPSLWEALVCAVRGHDWAPYPEEHIPEEVRPDVQEVRLCVRCSRLNFNKRVPTGPFR